MGRCFSKLVPCLPTVPLPTQSGSSVTSVACIVLFQVLYFNMPLYSRHTKLPRRKRARPCCCAAGVGHGYVPAGSAPVLAACAATSGAAGAGHGHVPGGSAPVLAAGAGRPRANVADSARRRLPCGRLLRSGRPRRLRPSRPRLHRHCWRRNSTAGKLPKAHQIMHNATT